MATIISERDKRARDEAMMHASMNMCAPPTHCDVGAPSVETHIDRILRALGNLEKGVNQVEAISYNVAGPGGEPINMGAVDQRLGQFLFELPSLINTFADRLHNASNATAEALKLNV